MNQIGLRISEIDWLNTWEGLRERSDARRESLCVWAGRREPGRNLVKAVIFMDQFSGVEGFELFHRVSRSATNQLFEHLHERKLDLIADVHTHPEQWVGLSKTDANHPMEFRHGFVSVVLPWYAADLPSLMGAGVHEYIGSREWRELSESEKQSRIFIGGVE